MAWSTKIWNGGMVRRYTLNFESLRNQIKTGLHMSMRYSVVDNRYMGDSMEDPDDPRFRELIVVVPIWSIFSNIKITWK